jgi:GrpB-like predicted nucleotidyltransferase (UPF0157 family)
MRVFLVPHDSGWAEEFTRESTAVSSALGAGCGAIHHIGSTAIPGIRAKPVIDMLAAVSDIRFVDVRAPQMEALGYGVMGEFGIPGRRYFRKDDCQGNRTHQVHVFQQDSPQIERHLAFRDFMRTHRECALRYDALKALLAAQYPDDIGKYTVGKDEFIAEMDARAAAWRSAGAPSPGDPAGR